MLSTNYSKLQWKNLILTFSLTFCVIVLPVLGYLVFVYLPLLDGWVIVMEILYGSLDLEFIKSQVESLTIHDLANLAAALYITAVGLIIVAMIPVYFMCVHLPDVSRKIAQKLHIYPMMNLVIFRNGKKIDEMKFKN